MIQFSGSVHDDDEKRQENSLFSFSRFITKRFYKYDNVHELGICTTHIRLTTFKRNVMIFSENREEY